MSASLPSELQAAIQQKTAGAVSRTLLWSRAVQALLALDEGDACENVRGWVQLFQHPESLAQLAACCSKSGDSPAATLVQLRREVDASDFSIEDWAAALEVLLRYLVRENRVASAAALFGYLQCTAEFSSHGGDPDSLSETVEKMLAAYGFEGSEGCSVGSGPAG